METMRQLLDQMDVLVEQAQQQQGQDTQTSTTKRLKPSWQQQSGSSLSIGGRNKKRSNGER